MKTKIWLISLLISANLYPQNAFINGIHSSDMVEYKDGTTHFSGSGFKIMLTGKCDAKYEVNELWNENNMISNYIVETSWNWKNIVSMEVDTVKNILRLNGRNPMPKRKRDADTGEITEDPNNNTVNIYFKTKVMVKDAGKWVSSQVGTCGGKVMLLN
jgi:hypothetical protein